MNRANTKEKESVSINIRVKIRQRDLIDQAAERLGRSRSDFMLEAACCRAEDLLLDQSFFTASEGVFEELQLLRDRPLPPTDKLHRLMKAKEPGDK